MKCLIIFTHPEPQSLCGSLFKLVHDELQQQGHETQTSDLYRMQWKSQITHDDFGSLPEGTRLHITKASSTSYASTSLTDDVKTEQSKPLWADMVIFVFPLWWHTFPSILKVWVERVFSCGFAYGVPDPENKGKTSRYGDGLLKGKQPMIVTTSGSHASGYSARGIQGPIDDVLFPIHRGVLFSPGFQVLPPIVTFHADKVDEAEFELISAKVLERMRTLENTVPIQFRTQNSGDYKLPELTLLEGREREGATGYSLHVK